MKKKALLQRIELLEAQVAELLKRIPLAPSRRPSLDPFQAPPGFREAQEALRKLGLGQMDYGVYTNTCSSGGFHDWNYPWGAITPPPCKKCGVLAPKNEITC